MPTRLFASLSISFQNACLFFRFHFQVCSSSDATNTTKNWINLNIQRIRKLSNKSVISLRTGVSHLNNITLTTFFFFIFIERKLFKHNLHVPSDYSQCLYVPIKLCYVLKLLFILKTSLVEWRKKLFIINCDTWVKFWNRDIISEKCSFCGSLICW